MESKKDSIYKAFSKARGIRFSDCSVAALRQVWRVSGLMLGYALVSRVENPFEQHVLCGIVDIRQLLHCDFSRQRVFGAVCRHMNRVRWRALGSGFGAALGGEVEVSEENRQRIEGWVQSGLEGVQGAVQKDCV